MNGRRRRKKEETAPAMNELLFGIGGAARRRRRRQRNGNDKSKVSKRARAAAKRITYIRGWVYLQHFPPSIRLMRLTQDIQITSSHESCTSVCSSQGQGAGAERIQKMSRNMRCQAPASVDTSEGVKSAKKKCDGETILHLGISAFPLAAFVHHSRRARCAPPSSFSSFHCLRAFVLSYNSCSRPGRAGDNSTAAAHTGPAGDF